MPSPTSNINTLYPRKSSRGTLAKAIVLLLCGLILVSILEAQNITDWFKLASYDPPHTVSAIAQEDTMTTYAYKLVRINHTQIQSKTEFSVQCPNNGGEQTIVLGCYHSGESGIFLLNVSDPDLDGVEQVTEAHEMLHSAYERLGTNERKYVDSLLLDYYNHGLTDTRLKSVIDAYKKTEPHDVVNEMHSVFGTEVMSLPKPLEDYYKQYFADRQAVARYAAEYQAVFTSRQAQAEADRTQLDTWKSQINSMEADLSTQLNSINSMQSQLNGYKSRNDISDYNAGVPGFNAKINQYNVEVGQLKSLINNYNSLVAQYNSVVLSENNLYKELSGYSKQSAN